MGGIYGVGLTYSPLLVLNLLLTVGLTFVIAITVSNLAIANVVPTPSIIMATGFLGGCLAIYASWGTSALLRMTEPNIQAFNPRFLMDYARFLYSNGSIEIVDDRGNHEIKGLKLIVRSSPSSKPPERRTFIRMTPDCGIGPSYAD